AAPPRSTRGAASTAACATSTPPPPTSGSPPTPTSSPAACSSASTPAPPRSDRGSVASPVAEFLAGGSKRSRCEAAPEGRTRGVVSRPRSSEAGSSDALASPAASARPARACGRGRQRRRWAFFSLRLARELFADAGPEGDELCAARVHGHLADGG